MKMKKIKITDIKGFRIGNAEDQEKGTGCTVVVCPEGAVGGVDVRGGGPATRETDLLKSENTVDAVNAVVLSGGSAFGLEAASGVMRELAGKRIGYDAGGGIYVPIVCGASLFDLMVGSKTAFPDIAMGMKAVKNAFKGNFENGNKGAGTGATVGKLNGMGRAMKSGLGSYACSDGKLQVGAVVAVNAFGDVYNANGDIVAGLRSADGTSVYGTLNAYKDMLEGKSEKIRFDEPAPGKRTNKKDDAAKKETAQPDILEEPAQRVKKSSSGKKKKGSNTPKGSFSLRYAATTEAYAKEELEAELRAKKEAEKKPKPEPEKKHLTPAEALKLAVAKQDAAREAMYGIKKDKEKKEKAAELAKEEIQAASAGAAEALRNAAEAKAAAMKFKKEEEEEQDAAAAAEKLQETEEIKAEKDNKEAAKDAAKNDRVTEAAEAWKKALEEEDSSDKHDVEDSEDAAEALKLELELEAEAKAAKAAALKAEAKKEIGETTKALKKAAQAKADSLRKPKPEPVIEEPEPEPVIEETEPQAEPEPVIAEEPVPEPVITEEVLPEPAAEEETAAEPEIIEALMSEPAAEVMPAPEPEPEPVIAEEAVPEPVAAEEPVPEPAAEETPITEPVTEEYLPEKTEETEKKEALKPADVLADLKRDLQKTADALRKDTEEKAAAAKRSRASRYKEEEEPKPETEAEKKETAKPVLVKSEPVKTLRRKDPKPEPEPEPEDDLLFEGELFADPVVAEYIDDDDTDVYVGKHGRSSEAAEPAAEEEKAAAAETKKETADIDVVSDDSIISSEDGEEDPYYAVSDDDMGYDIAFNTTIACLITNAKLTKPQANKLASILQDAYARSIKPVHGTMDGDTIFVLSLGDEEINFDAFAALATEILQYAVIDGAASAEAAYGLPASKDMQ